MPNGNPYATILHLLFHEILNRKATPLLFKSDCDWRGGPKGDLGVIPDLDFSGG